MSRTTNEDDNMATDFLSTTFRALRYCVASIGCVLSLAFVTYGSLLKLDDNDTAGLESDLIIGFGVFMATLSSCVGVLSRTGDRQVQQLISANNAQLERLMTSNKLLEQRVNALIGIETKLEANTLRFEQQLHNAEERHKARLKSLREENQRLSQNVDDLSNERIKFEKENEELAQTKEGFDQTLGAYKKQLSSVQEAHRLASEELVQLRILSAEGDTRVDQLERINAAQERKIGEMSKQLKNLNALQRKSTRMIQMLALYGDECKTMGLNLKDTAATLQKTDHSLGLRTDEMSSQVRALKSITEALKQVASAQGIDESGDSGDDDDCDEYNSVNSTPDTEAMM